MYLIFFWESGGNAHKYLTYIHFSLLLQEMQISGIGVIFFLILHMLGLYTQKYNILTVILNNQNC